MKSKTITLLSLLMILLIGCTENWQLKQVQSDIFLIDLPVGTSEVEKSTDGLHYYIEYKAPMPNDQSIYVEAFPWIKTPKEAMEIVGKHSFAYKGINHGEETDFDYNTISGVKYEGDDGSHLLKGEIFCFNKDGYTVIISSNGRYRDYRTIRDIVRSIKFGVPPMTNEQKEKAFNPEKIAQTLSKQIKQALNTYNGKRQICDSTSWALELEIAEDNTMPPTVHVNCWLSPQAIECLKDPIRRDYAFKYALMSPLELLNMPIAKSLQMREDNLLTLKFNYFDKYGNYLEIGEEDE
ncbi:hypothetical protein [uncultured Eubacterium sp.]|uniref:hypothetical protein n=1 Tax=uncultured Eubacterium sp. TaxID=165185 RepID=UPI0025987C04|nr:hypothetical protein [uncultured Eubacterium sp.]